MIAAQANKSAGTFPKQFTPLVRLLHGLDAASVPLWGTFEKSIVSLHESLKCFRAVFCEGLVVYAALSNSLSKGVTASLRAQEALIAGEMIDESAVQPALLSKLRECVGV